MFPIRLTSIVLGVFLVIPLSLVLPQGRGGKIKFNLTVHDLCTTKDTLVRKLVIEAPAATRGGLFALDYRWKDVKSVAISHGIWRKRGNKVEGTILFVAQLTPKADNHPAMLMMTEQQESEGKALDFQVHTVPASAKLTELVSVDVKNGAYAVGTPVEIGRFGDKPIKLRVSPAGKTE